jgi:hypothetical protein
MFPTTSRYYGIETAILKTAGGKDMAYTRRRFLPPAEKTLIIAEHTVTQVERLDNITARYLVDPEQFWRLCDANNAMRPEELTEVIGRRLISPLPQGGQ